MQQQLDPANLHLQFNGATLDYIVQVLQQRPFAEVARLIADIGAQVEAQQRKTAPEGGSSAGGLEGLPVLAQGDQAPTH